MNMINIVLSTLISSIGIVYILKNLTGNRFKKKEIVLFVFITTILLTINTMFFTFATRVMFSLIVIILTNYFILFKKNLGKSIYYSLIYVFLIYAVEIILTAIMLFLFKYSTENYNNFEYSMLLFSVINTFVNCLISKIKPLQKFVQKHEGKLLNNYEMKVYICLFTIIIIMLITNNYFTYEKNLSYYINIGMIIFVILMSVIIIYNKITKDNIEKEYNMMLEYVSKYEKIINEQGKKNHEYNNQLMVLNGYIDNKKKLKEYLETIIKEQKGGKNYTVEQLSYFPDGGIKGLIYHKLGKMEELGIRPFLYIDKEVKNVFEESFDVSMYRDITKLFGVFLDNAIEASSKADKKEIEIDMKIDDNYLIITIGNTYDKSVNIEKIGKKGFTTKGAGHGFGLSIVKDISKNNSKIETFNDIGKDLFKQTVMISLK